MRTYITGDFHWGHENIIKYTGRPFESIDQMNQALITNANELVHEDDVVYHVGDFSFHKPWSDIISQLNGTWVFLLGNHDFKRLNGVPLHRALELRRRGKRIYLNHHPKECLDIYGYDIYLTAHIHEKWKTKVIGTHYLINIGVDVWDFKPVNLDWLLSNYGDI